MTEAKSTAELNRLQFLLNTETSEGEPHHFWIMSIRSELLLHIHAFVVFTYTMMMEQVSTPKRDHLMKDLNSVLTNQTPNWL